MADRDRDRDRESFRTRYLRDKSPDIASCCRPCGIAGRSAQMLRDGPAEAEGIGSHSRNARMFRSRSHAQDKVECAEALQAAAWRTGWSMVPIAAQVRFQPKPIV